MARDKPARVVPYTVHGNDHGIKYTLDAFIDQADIMAAVRGEAHRIWLADPAKGTEAGR
jgi:hypothetical protein